MDSALWRKENVVKKVSNFWWKGKFFNPATLSWAVMTWLWTMTASGRSMKLMNIVLWDCGWINSVGPRPWRADRSLTLRRIPRVPHEKDELIGIFHPVKGCMSTWLFFDWGLTCTNEKDLRRLIVPMRRTATFFRFNKFILLVVWILLLYSIYRIKQ